MIKKIILSPWSALLTLVLVLSVRVADSQFIESVRLRYFDTLITNKAPTENNIYTVNVDEATLDKYGQWPLPRNEYAKIIEDLYKRNAGLVVFNVLMPDSDRSGQDGKLAYIMKQYPVILPNIPSDKTKNIPRNPGAAVLAPEWLDRIVQYPGIIANVPLLENSAYGVGTANTLPEIDGVNRRIPLIASVDGKLYPSLSMEVLRVAAGDTTFQVKLNENGVEKMRNRYRVEIYDDNKANDLTIYSDEGISREYLSELVFGNIRQFAGNVRAYVFDTKKKRKTLAIYLPMETVNRYNKNPLTKDELGLI